MWISEQKLKQKNDYILRLEKEVRENDDAKQKLYDEHNEEFKIYKQNQERQNKIIADDTAREIDILKKDHKYEMSHYDKTEIKKAVDKASELETKNKVLENENKMLKEMVDTGADIISIKELVTSLVAALPKMDIKSINVNSK